MTDVKSAQSGSSISRLLLILFAFAFGGFLLWSVFMPIEVRVVAPGEVAGDEDIVEVKAVTSARIQQLLVSNGDFVQKGQKLVEMEQKDITEQVSLLQTKIDKMNCQIFNARASIKLIDEYDASIQQAFDDRSVPAIDLVSNYQQPCDDYDSVHQIKLLEDRLKLVVVNLSNTDQKLTKSAEQIDLTKLRLSSLHSDMKSKKQLEAKKFASAAEIRKLQRDLDSEKINLASLIANQQELTAQLEQLLKQGMISISQFVNGQETELQRKEVTVGEDEVDIAKLRNELHKRIIYSPVDGIVIDTSSSVITNYAQQSELLLKIAPKAKLSILKARVDVADIDNFRHGGIAKVRFFSYADLQDNLYEAHIVTINPIVSQRNVSNWTEAFYEVTLKVTDSRYEDFSAQIINGTPVEVLFKAERTTLAKALMRPITKNWPRIFEQ